MPEVSTWVHLVRHAEPQGARGLALGHSDLPLSEAGLSAAQALAQTWRGAVPLLISSDLQRARQSAEPLAAALKQLPVALDARLRELDFGRWDGLSWQQLEATDSVALQAWMQDWVHATTPGGESFVQLALRAQAGLHAALARAGGRPLVLYAHAGSIRALLCQARGWPLERAFEQTVDYAHVSGLRVGVGCIEVGYLNAPGFQD